MISSLHISGFKLFRDLELPKLGSLNLFVGKNNTGKTCLLEAVELYASGSPWDMLRVASRREPEPESRKPERFDSFEFSNFLQPLLNLFHREKGHILKRRIRLAAGNPDADLELRCEEMLADIFEHEANFAGVGKNDHALRHRHRRHFFEDGFILMRGKKKSRPMFLGFALRGHPMLPIPEKVLESEGWLHPDLAPVAFLPACGFSNDEAKRLWDKASLADKDELLLEWLRFIEPEVSDLRYISDPDSAHDMPYLKINGDRGRTPLSSMGDGLTRLFHVGLAMANASGGILLIDEFENGLHWEVQSQLWGALFEAASLFGVQVFATTHSNDCIQAFHQAQKSRLIPSESYVYRLERSGDDVYALELPSENLGAALRLHVEVR